MIVGHSSAQRRPLDHYRWRKWVELTIPIDPLYLSVLVLAEKKFCVEPPRPHIEAVRTVDMSSSNSWAEFAAVAPQYACRLSRVPEDAKEAIGHGVRAKRSKSGAVSFGLLDTEATIRRAELADSRRR
jgi:hypothetical protein